MGFIRLISLDMNMLYIQIAYMSLDYFGLILTYDLDSSCFVLFRIDCNIGAGFAFGLPFACLSNKSALLAFFIRKAICKPWRFAKSVFFSVMIKNPPSSHQTGL
jgi:hypothetical protein